MSRRIHWALLLLATVASWVPIAALHRIAAEPAPGAVASGFFVAADGVGVPPRDAAWVPVTLPDDWRTTRPDVGAGWYRLHFVAGDAPTRLGVYLPTVAMNADVWVNGRPIGDGGRFAPTPARNWNRPQLFAIPARALVAGENVLDLRVVADRPGMGFLPPPAVAPLAALGPLHARATFVRGTLLWTAIVFRLVVATFTAAIFLMWRREPYYGWFALCVVAWVLAESNLVTIDIPVSPRTWTVLFNVAIGWWGILAVRLVLSFIGVTQPRAERGLMIAAIAGSLALAAIAASGSPLFDPLAIDLWLIGAFGASLYLFRGVLPRLRDYPDAIELNVVFVVALSVIGCVLFDLLMQLGLRPRGGLTVPPYSAFVAVLGMGWVLVRRFVGALTQAQALAVTLEERVQEQSRAVAASYERILATERARVLAEERQRILRDMDEGLGSQLVSTLALVESRESASADLQRSVRAALDDLRLIVDSLDPLEGDLLSALGMLRSRLQPRLEAAGVRVEWQVADLPPIADLTPHRVLQILRILQSVFAGVLGGGPGRTLRVTTRSVATAAGPAAEIEVAVVGGDPAAPVPTAAERERMWARARDIGAAIEMRQAAGTTGVRVLVPAAPSPDRGIVASAGVR